MHIARTNTETNTELKNDLSKHRPLPDFEPCTLFQPLRIHYMIVQYSPVMYLDYIITNINWKQLVLTKILSRLNFSVQSKRQEVYCGSTPKMRQLNYRLLITNTPSVLKYRAFYFKFRISFCSNTLKQREYSFIIAFSCKNSPSKQWLEYTTIPFLFKPTWIMQIASSLRYI